MRVSRVGVHKVLQKYKETRTRLGPTDEDGGSNEGARRAADEGQLRNNRHSTACSTSKQWLQNNTDRIILVLIVLFTNWTIVQYRRFVPYNGKECSVLPAFCKNETLALYCHILHVYS